MQKSRPRFSRIAPRLRLVLLTIALLVIAQPVFVYLTTDRIITEQKIVSDKLVGTAFRSSRLNKELARIAAAGRALQLQTDTTQLDDISTSLMADIESLETEFSDPIVGLDRQSSTDIADKLESYSALISQETTLRTQQLQAARSLREKVFETRRVSSEMLALLGGEIAAHKIALDRGISRFEAADGSGNLSQTRTTFNNLITLNSIADSITAERAVLVALEQRVEAQLPQTQRARLQLQMRNLATQVAKLQPGETQTAVARLAITLNYAMFGSGGIFEQSEQYSALEGQLVETASRQRGIAAELLDASEQVVDEAQKDVVASSSQAEQLLQRTREYTLWVGVLGSLLAVAAIVFVVERQFNRRITKLTDRVVAIATGREDSGEVLTGNDELSAMSDALVVFKRNASELRGANDALALRNAEVRQLSDRLETILDTTTSGIVAFDDEGQIILANRPARHFLGGISETTPFDRPSGVRFLNREDLAPLDASSDPINRVIAGQTLNNEIALMERSGGGDGRYVRITSNRVDSQDTLVRTVLAIDDVSVAEQNRQQIERASRLDALGQLTGGIAHDFNNLLATIQYAVQLTADAEDEESRNRFTKIALESVDRGSNLSNRLLSFAKRQPGVSKSLKVEKILADFKSLIEPTIEQLITLEFVVDERDMSVFCDGAQLENALLNLVLNARDAILRSGTGDKITIAVRGLAEISPMGKSPRSDPDRYLTDSLAAELREQESREPDAAYRYVEFSVSDNGPGMTEEVKRRAIDPFFTTKSTNSGTGLGLSMVYGFVQQSGGELRIYSETSRGTTMRLLLPRGSNDDAREEPMSRQVPVTGSGQRILVVEDEVHLLEAMHALISSLGYNIQTATSGREALKLIEDGLEFDLLLTDIVMPGGVGGFDLAAKVRKLLPEIPILYMSGYAAYSIDEMGVVVAPLLQKPCAPRELAEKLSDALS